MATRTTKKGDSTATIGFEAKRWLTADKLRNNMDAAEYKHVVLGLIFLKYISDTFEEHHARLIDVDCDGDSDAGQVNTYGHDSNAATRRSTAPTGSPNTTTRARTSASGPRSTPTSRPRVWNLRRHARQAIRKKKDLRQAVLEANLLDCNANAPTIATAY
ncbi:MAG: type I restriction-modification system subunit M N-terminal domain-containing protein [Candidatus Accumulibacter phosphatis]|uniref:type I restriction-modification system subunit M N-terminal domain-containing protein n=1 Tax=Candidatus Accumulibacter sp. ACC012 TaxID=2823332 RepID=UPI0025B9BD53|nr:type I restriction-modification system subunit M N-terminal domain-containing protein [Candidatus Accumulibacter sp. ACC012]